MLAPLLRDSLLLRPPADSQVRALATLGFKVEDPFVLNCGFVALHHRSASNQLSRDTTADPSRNIQAIPAALYSLGYAVTLAALARFLILRLPGSAGELSLNMQETKSKLTAHLAQILLENGIVVFSPALTDRERPSAALDVATQVLGALVATSGYAAAYHSISEMALQTPAPSAHHDPKTALQEISQARWRHAPNYTLVAETGPDHQKTFVTEVKLPDNSSERGSGVSKKQSEFDAAVRWLSKYAPSATSAHAPRWPPEALRVPPPCTDPDPDLPRRASILAKPGTVRRRQLASSHFP